jgi:glycosyltransferase involved in cell wall biosynthesis
VTPPDRDRPRLLLLAMYPLDAGRAESGPTVRIANMRAALEQLVALDVVSGRRGMRATALGRYAASGRLRGLAGIYVESSTALPGPADIAFLRAARRRGVPVLTYIRDAYQLFPEYWSSSTPRARLGRRLFLPALRRLAGASSRLAFPSQGLADALSLGGEAILLPPGAPEPVKFERRPDAGSLLVVGSLRHAVLGADLLLDAVRLARDAGHAVELIAVCRPGDEPPSAPPWVRIVRASGPGIHELLPEVLATVIPRRRSTYNDFAVPVKLMEYLAYGRPLLVTDCTETARIVRTAGCGLVVADTPTALAGGLTELVGASADEVDRWSAAAHEAARANSWHARAEQVVAALRSA